MSAGCVGRGPRVVGVPLPEGVECEERDERMSEAGLQAW